MLLNFVIDQTKICLRQACLVQKPDLFHTS